MRLAGGGALQRVRQGDFVVSTGPPHSIRRSVAAFRASDALSLEVAPETTYDGIKLRRKWIEGTEGCSFDEVFTSRGLRIAILDYVAGGYVGRPMYQNVIRDPEGALWAIDNEHAFRLLTEYGIDWEFGGLSVFLYAWTDPSMWRPVKPCMEILEPLMAEVLPRLSTLDIGSWGLDVVEDMEATCRIEALHELKHLGKAWKRWRGFADKAQIK